MRLGGSYADSISVLFLHRFLHRFLVDLGVDFGVILGGFGGSKSVILGIDFSMIFCMSAHACACGRVRRVDGSWERLRAAQERPRAAQERPRAAQEGPRGVKISVFVLFLMFFEGESKYTKQAFV